MTDYLQAVENFVRENNLSEDAKQNIINAYRTEIYNNGYTNLNKFILGVRHSEVNSTLNAHEIQDFRFINYPNSRCGMFRQYVFVTQKHKSMDSISAVVDFYKEIRIDNIWYVLRSRINILDGKVLSITNDLRESDLTHCLLSKNVIDALFEMLNFFYNSVINNVIREQAELGAEVEDLEYLYQDEVCKALESIRDINTYSEGFKHFYCK